ncbi:hypothetical protein DID78_05525 [Candidatus Marinamargulisbacteria bacterium SCGC AG-343-D04]|nr:hypothetical protein DID78_05525 [Candidatus Marinamargulisbacteria bacterium SCGC AG-343-D04]
MKKYILLLLILVSQRIIANPTISGPTGLVTMPSAEILKYKEYNLGFDYSFNLDDSKNSKNYYKMNVGALENTEFGFVGGSEPDEGVFLNFKWSLSSNSGRFPLLMAVGFEKLTSEEQSDFYIVTSKKIRADLGVHGGFKALFSNDIDISLMTGIDYSYNDQLIILGDITSRQNNKYYINTGILFKIFKITTIDNLYLKTSITNILRNQDEDSFLNIGFCYTNVL